MSAVSGFSFSGVQMPRAPAASSTGIALDLGGDAVERLPQAQVVAQRARSAPARAQLLDHLVGILAGSSACSRTSSSTSSSVTSMPSWSATASSTSSRATDCAGLARASCSTSCSGELAGQLRGRSRGEMPRRSSERARPFRSSAARASTSGPATSTSVASTSASTAARAEGALDLLLELLAQARLDVGAQLVERVELARGARELVVERRQHLLLDLLDASPRPSRSRPRRRGRSSISFVSPGDMPTSASLELVDEPAGAELDDVVALRLAGRSPTRSTTTVSPCCGGPVLDRRRARRPSLRRTLELVLDELLRHLGLRRAAPRAASSRPARASAARRPSR